MHSGLIYSNDSAALVSHGEEQAEAVKSKNSRRKWTYFGSMLVRVFIVLPAGKDPKHTARATVDGLDQAIRPITPKFDW